VQLQHYSEGDAKYNLSCRCQFLLSTIAMLFASFALLATVVAAAPKILICSDSTTANYKTSDALQGWGFYLGEYMSIKVINLAKNGRSTRSFIREGLWKTLLSQTAPGDFVIIEMGHNDVQPPKTSTWLT
jgi:rhamnogalacturonan acetylesterase